MSIIRAFVEVTGEDLSAPDVIHMGGSRFEVAGGREIVVIPPSPWATVVDAREDVRPALFFVAARLLYRQLRAVELYCGWAEDEGGERVNFGAGDIKLGDSRGWVGFRPLQEPLNDLTAARDVILEHELVCPPTAPVDAGLVYLLESLLRAVVYPKYTMAHLYKLMEFAKQLTHDDLTVTGVSEGAVKTLKRLANEDSKDERHAPQPGQSTAPLSEDQRMGSLTTARQIVSGYLKLRLSAAQPAVAAAGATPRS